LRSFYSDGAGGRDRAPTEERPLSAQGITNGYQQIAGLSVLTPGMLRFGKQ
jgi:hypothetical protein